MDLKVAKGSTFAPDVKDEQTNGRIRVFFLSFESVTQSCRLWNLTGLVSP